MLDKIYINYDQLISDIDYEQDNENYKYNEPGYYRVLSVSSKQPNDHYHEQYNINSTEKYNVGDTIYVVYVVYESGGTFGSSSGHGYIVYFSQDKENAKMVREWCYDANVKTPDDFERTYRPWEGYFENLTDVVIEGFEIS